MSKSSDIQRSSGDVSRDRIPVRRGSGARVRNIAPWRYYAMLVVMGSLAVLALSHVAGLQVLPDVQKGFRFLQSQGDSRTIRMVDIPAYRGVITDRRGEPLAISTPVVSICANPQVLVLDSDSLVALAKRLELRPDDLKKRVAHYANKEFVYLARQLTPPQAQAVLDLNIPGVFKREEYKRYYPAGEVAAQLIGFTGIDDRGQEGMELAFDEQLYGAKGSKRVLKDRKGQVIKELQLVKSEKPGSNLVLSIDLRIQYTAYRELKAAMKQFRAQSGSVVVLDVRSGEVLAMVNQPSYNPNDRTHVVAGSTRNRAVTDVIEPGSVMKPLTMIAALESGKFQTDTVIDTNPGSFRVGRKTFVDHSNYGKLGMSGILSKSSQVGTTKIAMQLEPENIRSVFDRAGLGQSPGTGFPGESAGLLPNKQKWRPVEIATLAFGYGMTVTPLQLARAYAVLANNGVQQQVSLLKVSEEDVLPSERGEQVIDADIAASVREMLKAVITTGGTGTRAAIPTYQVAGKTGTSHKVGVGGYQDNHYVGVFAGMAPADAPRLVTVVVIDDPQGKDYYGGLVAAPVFSKVTADALRLMSIPPVIKPPTPKLAEGKQVVNKPTSGAAS